MDPETRMVLNTARREFGGDVCQCCGWWHTRNPRYGIVWSVAGEAVCGSRCAAHLCFSIESDHEYRTGAKKRAPRRGQT